MINYLNANISPNLSQSPSNLVFKSAIELIQLLRSRSLSSEELLQAQLQHIATHNPTLNAVIALDAQQALAHARTADQAWAQGESWGLLHGLPMTIKDALSTAGLQTTFGNPDTPNYIPQTDAAIVEAVKKAGAIVIGKTNIPWMSYDWQCQHPTAGQSNNPWDVTRTPGGSSGGAAASLAAGFTPLELGSDAAGSIRLPAHFCGVCGLRPTEGRISDKGHMEILGQPHSIRSLAVVGPLARNIIDLQLLWSVLCQSKSASKVPLGQASAKSQLDNEIELRGLKLAWTPQLGNIPVDQAIQETYTALGQQLEAAGCDLIPVDSNSILPDSTWEELLELWGLIQGAEFIPLLPGAIRSTPLRHMVPPFYWRNLLGRSQLATAIARGNRLNVDGYLRLLEKRDRIIQQMDQFLSQWDGWFCPVAPTAAIAHCKPGTPLQIGNQTYAYADLFGMYLATTALFANPIVTFPVGQTNTGLPVGIQLHGRRWQDDRLLAIAQAITTVTDPLPTVPTGLV